MHMKILIGGLIAVIAISIAVSLIVRAVRRKDFQDQVSGKKPERKADGRQKISYDKPQAENPQIAADREGLRMKSGQNISGI